MDLTEASFQENEEKTKFYTGLPSFFILMKVFELCSPHIFSCCSNRLSKFQEFMLVLMRLRLNIPFQDLAYRFGISRSTVSRVFDKRLHVMNNRIDFLVKWPDRDNLRVAMPLLFKRNFGDRVSVIIDCFEVFINRPGNLLARAITWSNYKHHNTIKLLIGISLGGRTSDKYLTDVCSQFMGADSEYVIEIII